MAAEEEFLLKWHDHHQSFFLLVEELVMRDQMTDVTLACGDGSSHQLLSAHGLMLSVCSPYFRTLLSENRHKEKHHIIHLHGVSARHMQQLLLYMYRGEISISQEDLGPLIETARCLQVKGLSMATPAPPPPTATSPPKKRSYSAMTAGETSPGGQQARRRGAGRQGPRASPEPEVAEVHKEELEQEPETDLVTVDDLTIDDDPDSSPSPAQQPGAHSSPLPPLGSVALPVLPKPLSILKTAETRTFLSKLIWLGNGGRRPQYGNPETKPCWWPQHILPWEEMKKMGGRKSVELSHINYTEILKQCLAAGYEYFGYDPLTYYSSEPGADSFHMGDSSVMMEEEEGELGIEEDEEDDDDEKQREPVLEIDLDEVENCKADMRSSEQGQDVILCK